MSKRFVETDLWKKQRWFRLLSADHKLAFFYIKDQCDHAGIWSIDTLDLREDLGFKKPFDLDEFLAACNSDFEKISGAPMYRERLRIIDNRYLWIVGFLQFQYENKEGKVNAHGGPVRSGLQRLMGLNLFNEAVNRGYLTLALPLPEGYASLIEPIPEGYPTLVGPSRHPPATLAKKPEPVENLSKNDKNAENGVENSGEGSGRVAGPSREGGGSDKDKDKDIPSTEYSNSPTTSGPEKKIGETDFPNLGELPMVGVEGKYFFPTKKSWDLALPQDTVDLIREWYATARHFKISDANIFQLWKVFKMEFFNGRKSYRDAHDAFTHFFHISRKQNLELNSNDQKNGTHKPAASKGNKSAGAAELIESLKQDFHDEAALVGDSQPDA